MRVLFNLLHTIEYPMKKLFTKGNRFTMLICIGFCIFFNYKDVTVTYRIIKVVGPAIITLSGLRVLLYSFGGLVGKYDDTHTGVFLNNGIFLLLFIVAFWVMNIFIPKSATIIPRNSMIFYIICFVLSYIILMIGDTYEILMLRADGYIKEDFSKDNSDDFRKMHENSSTYGTYGTYSGNSNYEDHHTYEDTKKTYTSSKEPNLNEATGSANSMEDVLKKSIYSQLEVCKTLEELKRTRNNLSKVYHPDTEQGSDELCSYINTTFDEMKMKF